MSASPRESRNQPSPTRLSLADLIHERRWVAWRGEMRGPKEKQRTTKVPYAAVGRQAKSDDPDTWLTHDRAAMLAEQIKTELGGGVGLMLGDFEDTSLAGVDLDTCRDPQTGKIEPWARNVLDRVNTYSEVSPSGAGAKAFLRIDPADIEALRDLMGTQHGRQFKRANGSDHPPSIELYTSNRYFAATWQALDEYPSELRRVSLDDLRWLIEEAGPAFAGKTSRKPSTRSAEHHDDTQIDREALCAKLQNALSRRPRLRERWGGSTEGLNDASRSGFDFSLGGMLKAAGFSCAEMRWLIIECPHGAGAEHKTDARYFQRIWDRSTAEPASDDAAGDEKPTILVVGGLRHEAADAGLNAMVAAQVEFFQRERSLVRCAVVPAKSADGTIVLVPGIVTVDAAFLGRELGKAAVWLKINKRDTRRIDPPREVTEQILAMAGQWPFPPLRGVIGTQTMRPDGSLLIDEGYDPVTGYYLLAPPPMPAIPERPTKQDALAELALLKGLLADFPFVDDESRSVALSALMTPVLRAAMPVAPCHALTAPEAGSGKSYLFDTVSMIATGDGCAAVSMIARNAEEREKRQIGAAIAGHPIISLDNMTVPLEGDFLCQLTERPLLMPRPLGTSVMPRIPNSFTTCVNGNNLVIGGDMTRRTILATLDANLEDATRRTFASPSPIERIARDRGRYVAAVLTIARAYIVAGRPELLTLPSYDAWSALVRSPLVWLGQADPVATQTTLRDEDPRRRARRQVFGAWAEELPPPQDGRAPADVGWRTGALINAACEKDDDGKWRRPALRDALLEVAGLRADGEAQIAADRLGWWLRKSKNTIAAGYKLCVNDADKSRPRWWLAPAGRTSNSA